MDIKFQINRGNTDLGKWDQRKSTGAFKGAEDGFHVRTALEFRANDNVADILTNPNRLAEFIQPGDNVLQVFNRVMQMAVDMQPDLLGHLASVGGLGGSGKVDLDILAYDND